MGDQSAHRYPLLAICSHLHNAVFVALGCYPVRLRTRGRVITLSVHPWICLFVCVCATQK